jgi:glycosyltransferase involved in cell wall biosynthesis
MTSAAPPRLDIVIPVYNEGGNILRTLGALGSAVTTPFRVLICYDREDDDTLPAIRDNRAALGAMDIVFVRNTGRGVHGAIVTGFAASRAPFALVLPADDHYNATIIDAMVRTAETGCDIVCASRFMPGGSMVGSVAQGDAGARRKFHVASPRAAADARRLERLPPVLAPRRGRYPDRIGPRLLLQHRTPGEGASARLAHRRSAGQLVRANAGLQPLPDLQVAAGVSALVPLRLCHDISHALAARRAHEGGRGATAGMTEDFGS